MTLKPFYLAKLNVDIYYQVHLVLDKVYLYVYYRSIVYNVRTLK